MSNIKSLVACAFVVLALNGCFKVENKKDDEVIDALERQNEILQEQVEQAEAAKSSVTLTGLIFNVSTDTVVSNASVSLTMGSSVSLTAQVVNGVFEFKNLPADSDYVLVLHSNSNDFMNRTIFGSTRETTSAGAVLEDLGQINVAAEVVHQFRVIIAGTTQQVPSLVFYGSSNIGTGSTERNYWHRSTFNPENGVYSISLPEQLDLFIAASLDLDGDGVSEYLSNNESSIVVNASDLSNTDSLFVSENPWASAFNEELEVRVAVIDSVSNFIPGLTLFVQDSLNGSISSTYDSTTNQYVITPRIGSSVEILLPGFKTGSTYYDGSHISITRGSEGRYHVSAPGYGDSYIFDSDEAPTFNITLKPNVYMPSSNLRVISSTTLIDPVSYEYKVFYSDAIELLSDSVKLNRKDILQVIRGNDSDSDTVLPGVTDIRLVTQEVPLSINLALSETMLVTSPSSALSNGSYEFVIGYILDKRLGVLTDLWNDKFDFSVKSSSDFDINSLVLDNNNYYNLGHLIRSTNTAGSPSSPWNSGGTVYLYLPDSIDNLKTLTLSAQSYTSDNVLNSKNEIYSIVNNGTVNASSVYLVSSADNETVFTGSGIWSAYKGTSLMDGKYHYVHIGNYLNDNTDTNANNVTFMYAYETKQGIKNTGTITLPVR